MSALLVQGDHRHRLTQLLGMFGYRDTGRDSVIDGPNAVARALEPDWMVSETVVRKPVTYVQGWTVIFDLEMVMEHNDAACSQASSEMGSRVFIKAILGGQDNAK